MLFQVGATPIINCATEGLMRSSPRAKKGTRRIRTSSWYIVLEKSYANFRRWQVNRQSSVKRLTQIPKVSEGSSLCRSGAPLSDKGWSLRFLNLNRFHGKNLVFSSDVGNRHESRLPQIGYRVAAISW
jgi:hypothetical protein